MQFERHLRAKGLSAKGGQIVDATIIEAPRQRNSREENAQIALDEIPAEWDGQTNKIAQKDVDARWTKKRGQTYFGYKNHVNVDAEHKLIREYTVTDASVHDSQVFEDLVDLENGDPIVYADSAYRSAACEKMLANAKVESRIHERAQVNAPLSDSSKEANREKSRIRVRIEHVFGFVYTSMNGGGIVRTIGGRRAQVGVALSNLAYNLSRFVQIVAPRRKWAAA
jgi:IS5 family transposase